MNRPLGFLLLLPCLATFAAEEPKGLPETVSYYKHVRPVFQAKCQGCHQPAKSKSDYIMTEVASLIAGGENGAAVVPGQAAKSHLAELIVPAAGEKRAEMPPKDEVLTDYEVSLVRAWIDQGATDDTPENARHSYSMEHPPVYTVAPGVISMAYSPDGQSLAVAGFHEVLIHKADGSGLAKRLIGLSERIESVAFSPDGTQLAVAGGLPGRMGEIQIWDLANTELKVSKIVGFDTAYGVSWSPDGTLVSFGLPDNTARAIKASNGEQVLFMGGHSDWVLDTTWSKEGTHLVSVARDMSAKLTEVKTERFIDNITSITPGALAGGLNVVERHPTQDHVLVGGADGVPQIYRMVRETARKIGDNANLIRKYPAMKGRIWDAAFAPDGKTFVAVSSLDGQGQVHLYRSEYDATISPELKKLFETARAGADQAKSDPAIDEFQTRGAELITGIDLPSPVFSVAFSPDGKTIAVGTAAGQIQLLKAADLSTQLTFAPVEVDSQLAATAADRTRTDRKKGKIHSGEEALPEGRSVKSFAISPSAIDLAAPDAYQQALVTATLDNGETADVTRMVTWKPAAPLVEVSATGVVRPLVMGDSTLTATLGKISADIPVKIAALDQPQRLDFVQDVNPVITRLGCNMGTCHGAKDGKNGFKLSLRGYDPLYDVRAFSDDHSARRVNFASPDDSLMLLKATGAVPHEAGQVTEPDSRYYHTIRAWIAGGAKVDLASPRATSIELLPKNPVVPNIGAKQQFRVIAHYADGRSRDVTLESFIDSGNTEVAEHDDFGLLATVRRGEAPILARYEGSYAATTLTVMGDRSGFTWKSPETWGEIDQLVSAKWERMRVSPSELCTDDEFVRRIHLDLTGLPPATRVTKDFLADPRPTREKRDALIDSLIGNPEFVDHWTNKWSDMLQVNSKFLGGEGAKLYRDWIREQVAANTPYDQFVYSVLAASGSNKEHPAASYYNILRELAEIMENTTHLFLATRFNCNKCHDHPFERWTQDQYYQTAAYFAQVDLQRDSKNAPKENLGGSAVEGAKPLYEVIADKSEGEIKHDRTGVVTPPKFPYSANLAKVTFVKPDAPTRREELAAWIASPDNDYFAASYANRIWGYLLGTGIIEPLDDIRAGNPPSNPQLLDYLAKRFIDSKFDIRALIAEVCKSRTYQLSIETHQWNEDDEINFSHAKARRLPAEVLFDAVNAVTGAVPDIPGAGKGIRASQLADAKLDLKSGFLANLGRPVRESSCECERSDDLQMSAVMAFLSGPAIADSIGSGTSDLPGLVASHPEDDALISELYYRTLSRAPSAEEISLAKASMAEIAVDHETLVKSNTAAEAAWVAQRSGLEIKRLQAIASAQAAIDAYTPAYTAAKTKAEAEQKARITAAAKAVADREAELPKLVGTFSASVTANQLWTRWSVLPVESAVASDKTKVEILPDGSIRSAGGNGKRNLDILVTGKIAEQNITGLMIESIPDETFAGFGAGLSGDGNFVLTELQPSWKTLADPKKALPLAFADAKADFNQNEFDVKNSFNGNVDRNDKGWALSGTNLQIPHRAVFSFKEVVPGDKAGAQLILNVMSRYSQGEYPLGRFRIHYTTDADPLQFGLPATVAASVATPPSLRNETHAKALAAYVAENDADLRGKQFAHLKEQRPLPVDPKMTELTAAVTTAETPVAEPAPLLALRQDLGYSIQQSASRRLTAAQDLIWALVNSPSLLFNR